MYPPDATAPEIGGEPPAVISLLAGHLDDTGYRPRCSTLPLVAGSRWPSRNLGG
jgi:hypothetical protein